jgi:hypothetical protein
MDVLMRGISQHPIVHSSHGGDVEKKKDTSDEKLFKEHKSSVGQKVDLLTSSVFKPTTSNTRIPGSALNTPEVKEGKPTLLTLLQGISKVGDYNTTYSESVGVFAPTVSRQGSSQKVGDVAEVGGRMSLLSSKLSQYPDHVTLNSTSTKRGKKVGGGKNDRGRGRSASMHELGGRDEGRLSPGVWEGGEYHAFTSISGGTTTEEEYDEDMDWHYHEAELPGFMERFKGIYNKDGRVGIYNKEERKGIIERFKKKKVTSGARRVNAPAKREELRGELRVKGRVKS